MIPLKDDNPTKNKTHIRSLILILCSIVFFIQLSLENSNYSKVKNLSDTFIKICKKLCKENDDILESLANIEPKSNDS